nr:concanavalin A-like lectin/glucanase domain-containing protein [Tanacetum cinerariifolium]GEY98655.1 concanavalin A-like lectin/glucanase domain-containing protein [Tanacetum cinerariifolium]
RVSDLNKVETTTLIGYKMMAYLDKSAANQMFAKLVDKMIAARLERDNLLSKKAKWELMRFKEY